LLELSAHPGFDSLMVDEKWHWLWAQEILNSSFWGTGAYFRGPLYPYFLSGLIWITDSSVFWTKALQLFICGGIGVLLYKLTRQLLADTAAKVAVIIYACYGTFLFYDTMLLVEILFLFFALWAVCRLVLVGKTGTVSQYLIIGILFGLSALARPNILLVLPFLALWLFWKNKGGQFKWASPIALALGAILAIAPVTVRNYLVTGDFILISSQGGVNFYIGNNPDANGLTMVMSEIAFTESIPWDKFVPVTHAQAEKEAGRSLTESEASAYWNAKAWNYIQHNFGSFISLTLKKFRYLFSGFENSDNGDIYYQRTQSYLYAILLWSFGIFFPFGFLLPLAIVGVYLTREKRQLLTPIYIILLAYIPSIILFLVTARHRLFLVLLLIPFAAFALVWGKEWLQKRHKRQPIGIPLLILFITLIACNIPYHQKSNFDDFQIHYNEALKYQNAGELVSAEREYIEAAKFFTGSSTLYNNLGYIQFTLGKTADAERNLRQSLTLTPDFYQPYNNLGLLYEQRKQYDSARVLFTRSLSLVDTTVEAKEQIAQLNINLARSWQAIGATDSAVFYYYTALRTTPRVARTISSVAIGFINMKKFDIADSLFQAADRNNILTAADAGNWGLSYLERKDFANAAKRLRQSYTTDSTQNRIALNLAIALHETKAPADSVMRYVNRSLQLKPDYEAALKFRSYLQTLPAHQ
jgi:Flp pilus assembly protein TadD/4-amino-4-deoxy-L-arabinose transferase-like glycosyltransferase